MNMNKLLLRKLILTGAVAVLAVIYAVQLCLDARSPAKTFKLEKSFDSIQIVSSEKTLELNRYGDFWKIGNKDADAVKIEDLTAAIKEIKTLGVVSKSSDESALERYGFGQAQKLTVKAYDNGKELLSLEIGKDAASGQQNYIMINGKSEIYLAGGALKQKFTVTEEELIKKIEETPVPAEENKPELNAL